MTIIRNPDDAYNFLLAHKARVIESVKGDNYASTLYRLDDGTTWSEYASLIDPNDFTLTKLTPQAWKERGRRRTDPAFHATRRLFVILLILAGLLLLGLLLTRPAEAQARRTIGGAEGEAEILPTRAQVFAFLAKDLTDAHEYIHGAYECDSFSMDLVAAARAHGLIAVEAQVEWNAWPTIHVFVAFTTSSGVIWIEPQSDTEYTANLDKGILCSLDPGGWCFPNPVSQLWYWSTPTSESVTIYNPARDIWGPAK